MVESSHFFTKSLKSNDCFILILSFLKPVQAFTTLRSISKKGDLKKEKIGKIVKPLIVSDTKLNQIQASYGKTVEEILDYGFRMVINLTFYQGYSLPQLYYFLV